MDSTVDIGVTVGVVFRYRIDDRLGFLGRSRIIEINQRLPVGTLGQDRKIGADAARIEGVHCIAYVRNRYSRLKTADYLISCRALEAGLHVFRDVPPAQ